MTPATFRQRAIARCVDIGVLFLLTLGALAGFVEEQPGGGRVSLPRPSIDTTTKPCSAKNCDRLKRARACPTVCACGPPYTIRITG